MIEIGLMKKPNNNVTIESIENKLNIKLTYPMQFIEGNIDDEKYSELIGFGCSDIMDNVGNWIHRDCFTRKCETCEYYSIIKKYRNDNGVNTNNEPDFNKVISIMNSAKILDDENDKFNLLKFIENLKKKLGLK